MSQDLYRALGVDRGASSTDIKKAFQKLALKHHPDKGGKEEDFKTIGQAYEVLSDESKRKHYDMTGQIPGEQMAGPPGGSMPFAFPFDIGNLFGMFGAGGRPGMRPKGAKAPPKRETLKLTLAQLYFGHSFQIHLDRTKLCGPCSGTGAKRKESCGACGGQGMQTQTINLGGMMMHTQGPCPTCNGEGSRVVETCDACAGRAKIQEKKAIDVRIPAGTQSGETFNFPEVCSEVPEFEKAGDLQLTIECPAEGIWRRIGSGGQHLETEVVLNLAESLLGVRVKLDGHPGWDEGLYVQIPAASFTGDSYCITGLGMPLKGSMNQSGDLYLKIRTTVKLAERESLKGMKEALTGPFGPSVRAQEELPKDTEVQTELFLTKMP